MSNEPEWEPIIPDAEASSEQHGNWLVTAKPHYTLSEPLSKHSYIGIDFGTSTSVVSLVSLEENGTIIAQPLTLEQPLELGGTLAHHLINTVLVWHNGKLLFGQDAHRLRQKHLEGWNVFSSFKMRLGVDIGPTYPETALKRGKGLPFAIEDANDATREFFKCLLTAVRQALAEQDQPADLRIAVSVPASFEANQRRDLLQAMAAAGLKVTEHSLIDEPNAAFLSYLREASLTEEETSPLMERVREGSANILVYDFGAGTCDISILTVDTSQGAVKSRNRAISRFTALGGDNFDRAIARDVLLPQLLEDTPGFDPEYRDIEERLIPLLQPSAERLKIAICTWLADRNLETLDQMREQKAEPFVDLPTPSLKLRGREIHLNAPSLSLAQLADVFAPFMEEYDPDISTKHLFAPVDDALKKAGIQPDDLDAVLFIGGSSANPVVRRAVMNHLPNTVQVLVPSDLRSHVSVGAALHSLGLHALGQDVIQPITSESIFIITRGGGREILIPASSEVPTKTPCEIHCGVAEEEQREVELPICVGSRDKLLGVLRIISDTGFHKGEPITVHAHITRDKILEVEALVAGTTVRASLMNPLANRELNEQEKAMLIAKQRLNTALLQYGSKPPVSVVIDYAYAAMEAEAFEIAADMFRAAERIDASLDCATNIGYCYGRAGKRERSIEWAKQAYQRQKSPLTAYNLSVDAHGTRKETLLRQALEYDSEYVPALHALGFLLLDQGKPEGRAMLKKCSRILKEELDEGTIDQSDLRRLIAEAKVTGQPELVEKANAVAYQQKQKNEPYTDVNLAESLRSVMIEGGKK